MTDRTRAGCWNREKIHRSQVWEQNAMCLIIVDVRHSCVLGFQGWFWLSAQLQPSWSLHRRLGHQTRRGGGVQEPSQGHFYFPWVGTFDQSCFDSIFLGKCEEMNYNCKAPAWAFLIFFVLPTLYFPTFFCFLFPLDLSFIILTIMNCQKHMHKHARARTHRHTDTHTSTHIHTHPKHLNCTQCVTIWYALRFKCAAKFMYMGTHSHPHCMKTSFQSYGWCGKDRIKVSWSRFYLNSTQVITDAHAEKEKAGGLHIAPKAREVSHTILLYQALARLVSWQ